MKKQWLVVLWATLVALLSGCVLTTDPTRGEQGETGPKGEQGETGPKGEQGPIGLTGPTGTISWTDVDGGVVANTNVGIGTLLPMATLDLRGTSGTNDVVYEKIGSIKDSTSWVTIFSVPAGVQPQAAAFIDIVTMWNTPSSVTCKLTVMARGDLSYVAVQSHGDVVSVGCNGISFRWTTSTLPSSFQVSASDTNIGYVIHAKLYSIGTQNTTKWNHTWGTTW